MTVRKAFFFLILTILLVGLFEFIKPKPDATNKIQISASFYPLYFFASEIVKDKAVIFNLTPTGVEPHDYEPSTRDLARIQNSDLVIYNGGGIDNWIDEIKNNFQKMDAVFVSVGDVNDEQPATTDPHVWLSPLLAKKQVVKILAALKQIDENNYSFYETNAKALDNKLSELDVNIRKGLKDCKQRDIVTSHTAFTYFAQDYGLTQIAIAGLSPDEEPSPKRLVEIAKFAQKNNVKYIFFETLVSPKLSETIAREVGAETLALNPIEGLGEKEIKEGKNYFTEMENNLYNLQIALQCQ